MAKNFEQKGETLSVAESTLQHLDPGDGLVDSGQPVTFGAQEAAITDNTTAIPAGGSGAAAGAWDTAGNRDTAITEMNAIRVDLNSVLAALRAVGIIGANGRLSGVAQIDAKASTDIISVHRKGVYRLSVTGKDAAGNAAVAVGDAIFLDIASSEVNKDSLNGILIGHALATVSSGATTTIPVLLKDS